MSSVDDAASGAPPVLLPLSLVGLHSISYSSDDTATTVPAVAAASAPVPAAAADDSDSDPEHTQLQVEPTHSPFASPLLPAPTPSSVRRVRPVPFDLTDDDRADSSSDAHATPQLLPLPALSLDISASPSPAPPVFDALSPSHAASLSALHASDPLPLALPLDDILIEIAAVSPAAQHTIDGSSSSDGDATSASEPSSSPLAAALASDRAARLHLSPLRMPSSESRASAPLSPLSPLPGTLHPYSIYLARQTPMLRSFPQDSSAAAAAAASTASTSSASPAVASLRCALRSRRQLPPSSPSGFLFVFLDRLIEEGENFLLYSYPSSSHTARRILGMRGVLSVLEGAVAAVTGQKAQVAVLEEEGSSNHASAASITESHAPPPLRVKACCHELTGIGAGLAFVALTWHPAVSDSHLRALTTNVLKSLRATIGPIHSAIFKPHSELVDNEPDEDSTKASKKKKTSKLQPFWSALQKHRRARMPAHMTISAAAAADASPPLPVPVMASDLLPSLIAPSSVAPSPLPQHLSRPGSLANAAPLLPSDSAWVAQQRRRMRETQQRSMQEQMENAAAVQAAASSPAAASAVAAAPSMQDSPLSSPPAGFSGLSIDASSSTLSLHLDSSALSPTSASHEQLLREHTVLCCSWESMHLLDAFFEQVAESVCKQLLRTAGAMEGLGAASCCGVDQSPASSAAAGGSFFNGCASASPSSVAASASRGEMPLDPAGGVWLNQPRSAPRQLPPSLPFMREVVAMHMSSFLSPSLVPRAPSLEPSWKQAVESSLDRLLSSASTASSAASSSGSPSSMHPFGSPTGSPSPAAWSSAVSQPPAVLGALLFHEGALVHVARAPTHATQAASRSIRNRDVHELCNLITILRLLEPTASMPQDAAAAASPSAASSPSILHASTHTLWLAYTAYELSPLEADMYHVRAPPPVSLPLRVSTSVSSVSSTSSATHTRNATMVPNWSPQSSPLSALSPSSSSGNLGASRRATASGALGWTQADFAADGPSRPLGASRSSSNLQQQLQSPSAAATAVATSLVSASANVAADPAAPVPFSDRHIFQAKTVSFLKVACPSQGRASSELLLVLVMDAHTPRQTAAIEMQAELQVEQRRTNSKEAGGADTVGPHAFFMACSAYHPALMMQSLTSLCDHLASTSADSNAAAVSPVAATAAPTSPRSPLSPHVSALPARQALSELADLVRSDSVNRLRNGSSFPSEAGGSGVHPTVTFAPSPTASPPPTLKVAVSPPTPSPSHVRSRSTSAIFLSRLSLGSGKPAASPPAPAPVVSPEPLSFPGRAGSSGSLAGHSVVFDYMLLHHGRGVIIRPNPRSEHSGAGDAVSGASALSPLSASTAAAIASPVGASSARAAGAASMLLPASAASPSATTAALLPPTLELDFLSACSSLHSLLQRFQQLHLNTSAAAITAAANLYSATSPPSSVVAGASPIDRDCSLEDLGRGNHVYFRRHKSLETIRHVHECGTRIAYAKPFDRAFWVKGSDECRGPSDGARRRAHVTHINFVLFVFVVRVCVVFQSFAVERQ